jgi:hypothetical protein
VFWSFLLQRNQALEMMPLSLPVAEQEIFPVVMNIILSDLPLRLRAWSCRLLLDLEKLLLLILQSKIQVKEPMLPVPVP